MTANIQQFKQQTFSLIKEQVTKIKTHTKQIQIKQEQIKFLKQTISTLEQENYQLQRSNTAFKNKIDIIMKEVSHYNDTVVHKLHSDNQMLNKRVIEVNSNLQQNLQTIKRLTKQLQVSQQKSKKILDQFNKHKETITVDSKQNERLKSQNFKLKQLNNQNQKTINKLQAVNQQLTSKLVAIQKQNEALYGKCQDTINSYEKKVKNMKQNLIKKDQYIKIEQQLKKNYNKIQFLNKQISKLTRQKNQSQLLIKIAKQKQTSAAIKAQIQNSLLQSDLRTLKDSCKIGKKVSQFQSNYSQIIQQIYDIFSSEHTVNEQIGKKNQFLQQKVVQYEKVLLQKQSWLQQSKNELELAHEKLKAQSQTIQSSYQGKILQLSIKIKKQQKAIQQFAIKDRQFKALHEEYQKLTQQHIQMKQSLQNTIQQYKKQNQKLIQQIQQLIQLCDDNINTKNYLNSLKHSINNLIAVIYYLHLNLVRARESRRKLYLPFIDFYFKTRYALENKQSKQGKRKKSIRKFRACVIMIVAIKRMEKGAYQVKNSLGLYRYMEKAIKYKGKIDNLNQYLQDLLEKTIKNQKNVVQLLKENKNVYKWSCLHNYLKINLPTNWYKKILSEAEL